MEKILVSIVIPVYNVELYLSECIESVINQSYTNLEIILVDDGSTDSSGKICDEYCDKDNRIKVIHKKNGGLSDARNAGLDAVTGEFVYFLDSDDYIHENAIECLIDRALEEKSDVVFCDGNIFFDGCDVDNSVSKYTRKSCYESNYGREMLKLLLDNNEYRTPVQFLFLKRVYLINNHIRFYKGILHEDELYTFLVFNANGHVSHCHERLYERRIRPESIMTGSKMIYRYTSMLTVYNVIQSMYDKKEALGEAARLYLVRTAKNVQARYNAVPVQERESISETYTHFNKDVLAHHGYGDMKLKLKCSTGIRHFLYRVENKLLRVIKG